MAQSSKAIQLFMTIGLSAGAMALATGCSTPGPTTQSNANFRSDVTDVRPAGSAQQASYQPPVYDTSTNIPVAVQPVTSDRLAGGNEAQTAPILSTTPDAASPGEKTHTVRRGETLFSIARSAYGTGKDWKKIVSANPGVSPSKLKVGQVLVMPS